MYTEKLRVLIVEDTERHVESALRQFAGREFVVCRTATEATEFFESARRGSAKFPDIVLTDLFVRAGLGLDGDDPDRLILAGLAVAAIACQLGIPCLVLTDGGGDRHPLCRMLATAAGMGSSALAVRSSPVPEGSQGKDWLAVLRTWPEAPEPVRRLTETSSA